MTTATQQGVSIKDLSTIAEAVLETGPPWLREIKGKAIARFGELGIPTRRDEEWRFTNLRPIEKTSFALPPDGSEAVDADDVKHFSHEGLGGAQLVFINGRFSPAHSNFDNLPKSVTVCSLAEAFASQEQMLKDHLTTLAEYENEAFTALNTAFIEDGAFVHIPKGVLVEQPIHVLCITSPVPDDVAYMTNPRTVVIAEESSDVTVIEDYVSLNEGDVHLTNGVTEVFVGKNAGVKHYFFERESREAFNIATLVAKQQQDSRLASQSLLFGGRIVRNNVVPILDGEGCDSLLNGLYLPTGKQLMDNHMRVVHARPNCNSRQYYKGIVNDDATGLFSGRIVVVEKAQKTDAIQSNQNLLLSDTARSHTKPQLEIYADDVTCTHGATVGQLDEKAIFYMRQRGLSEERARGMLIYAFAAESLDRLGVEPIRLTAERMMQERIPHVEPVEEVL